MGRQKFIKWLLLFTGLLTPSVILAQLQNLFERDHFKIEVVSFEVNKPQGKQMDITYGDSPQEPGTDILLRIINPNTARLMFDPNSLLLELRDSKNLDLILNGKRIRESINQYRNLNQGAPFDNKQSHLGSYLRKQNCQESECLLHVHTDAIPSIDAGFLTLKLDLKFKMALEARSKTMPFTLSSSQEKITVDDVPVTFNKIGGGGRSDDYIYEYYQVSSDLVIYDVKAFDPNEEAYPPFVTKIKDENFYGLPAPGYPIKRLFLRYARTKEINLPLYISITPPGGIISID